MKIEYVDMLYENYLRIERDHVDISRALSVKRSWKHDSDIFASVIMLKSFLGSAPPFVEKPATAATSLVHETSKELYTFSPPPPQ